MMGCKNAILKCDPASMTGSESLATCRGFSLSTVWELLAKTDERKSRDLV
jgi:hypothetical protein